MHGGQAGGIVGSDVYSNLTINNCYNKAEITTPAPTGGILGYAINASKIIINGSYNKGAITSQAHTAGILGYATNDITIEINNCYNEGEIKASAHAGGILAFCGGGTITTNIRDSYNKGTVTSTDGFAGGILAYVSEASSAKIEISNCYNESEIKAKAYAGGILTYCNVGTVTSKGHAGGIVGWIKTGETTINFSHNIATITGIYFTGGIVGYSNSITAINDCYNNGEITATGENAGGIISRINNNLTINRCYNSNTITVASATVGGIVGICEGTTTSIADCYNTGYINDVNVSTTHDFSMLQYRGGIIGSNGSTNITVTRCYNAATKAASWNYADSKGRYIVGNQGKASYSDFTNTFYTFSTQGLCGDGFAKKKDREEMRTDEFLEELKGSANNTAWKRDPKKNDGMPILSWQ